MAWAISGSNLASSSDIFDIPPIKNAAISVYSVITSYSIHYTKLYDEKRFGPGKGAFIGKKKGRHDLPFEKIDGIVKEVQLGHPGDCLQMREILSRIPLTKAGVSLVP